MPSSPLLPQLSVSALHTHSSDSEMDRHLNEFLNNKHYQCTHPGCRLQFQRRDQFDRHEFSHTGVKRFACPLADCGRLYSNQSHLKRHTRTAHTVKPNVQLATIPCSQLGCRKKFANTAIAQRHFKQQHGTGALKRQQCDFCTESFHRKDQLRRHRFQHTGQYPYRCESCDSVGFFNQRSYRQHNRIHHKHPSTHRCTECTDEFPKWSLLVQHRREQHLPRCVECGKEFTTPTNLRVHMAVHTSDRTGYACTFDKCAKFYYSIKNLRTHERSKHGTAPRFECDLCGSQLSTKQKLTNHWGWHIRSKAAETMTFDTTKQAKKPRRRRKDANQPRLSTAAKLSGVWSGSQMVERMIRDGRGDEVVVATREHTEGELSQADDSTVVTKVLPSCLDGTGPVAISQPQTIGDVAEQPKIDEINAN